MTSRQAIIQANIAFMYGRDEEAARHDPDKRKLLPSSSHSSSTKTIGSYYHKKKIDEKEAVKGFSGEWAFLAANFECEVHLKGSSVVFPSMEHALQASRTNDTALQSEISQIKDTREMKRTAMRLFKKNEKWNEISPDIAAQLLRDKFFRHKDLCRKLMATEHRSLVNANTYNDKFWGVCDGFGQNKLGELLEKVRALHEQGKLRDYWIRDHFELEDSDKISVEVTVEKHGHVLSEYCEKVERKNLISIGKSDDNDVLLDHPTTSRVHAMLLADRNRGLLLIDLGAANGTRVDGKPVPPMTPMAIASSKIIVQFAASSREYTFSYDSEADKKRKEGLYARLAASNQDDSTTKGGKTSFSSPETTVFVGNLSYMSTENDLRSFFSTCGEVASIHLPKDRHSGESRGIAFVTFEKPAGLLQALSRDGDELQGRELKIKKSENNSSKSSKLSKASQFPSSSRSKDYSGGDAGHYGPGKSPSRALPREKSAERRGEGKSERFSRSRSRSASPRARDMRDRGRDSGRKWRRSRERTEARADRHGHSHYGNSDYHSRSASRSSVSRSPQSRDSYRDRGWRRSRDRGVDRHRRHSRSPSRSASRSSSRSSSRSRDRDRGRRARERSGRGGRSRANRHSRSPSWSSSRSRSASLERSYKRRRKKRPNSRGRSFSGDSRSDKS